MWRASLIVGLVALSTACTPSETYQPFDFDAGGLGVPHPDCPSGYQACEWTCCADGTTCVAGECKYPYSTASLHVYLCPSFNTGNCKANFFALDQMCTPIQATGSGVCYDTKLEVAANKSYGLASCLECGSGCSSPSTLWTPPGFVERQYYSGHAFSCGGDKCVPPPDCGGPREGGAGVPACATSECWLEALQMRESGSAVPLVVLQGASPPSSTSTSDPGNTPQITKLNGMSVAMSSVASMLTPLLEPSDTADLSYDFDDPTGASPGVCVSMARCPKNLRCNLGTSVCSHSIRDGALVGSVIRTLGFKAEPADPAMIVDLPLLLQPIAGPMDPATGERLDPIDDTDPDNPVLAPGALVGDPVEVVATIVGPAAPGGIGGSGAMPGGGAGGAGGAGGDGGAGGAGGAGSCGLPSMCASDADCSRVGNAYCDPSDGARCGADGLCHCCLSLCSSSGGACSCISCDSNCSGDRSCIGSVCAFNVGAAPCD